jgi:hypothetical protein
VCTPNKLTSNDFYAPSSVHRKVVIVATPRRPSSHRRIISGRSPRQLGLLRSPNTEQYESEASLFEEMAQNVNPLATPFEPNVTLPMSQRNLPAQYQDQSGPANVVNPQQTDNYFMRTMSGMNSGNLHKIIAKFSREFDAASFIDSIKYQGFNRDEFINAALQKITPHQLVRLALIGSIRGANFEKIAKSSSSIEADILEMINTGLVTRRAKKSTDITILRCSAAIPQWTAYFMGTAGVPKKFGSLSCPSTLQFSAAGALPMSATVRAQHVQFAIHFSRVIGGQFNENIYLAMVNNMLSLSEIPDELKVTLGVASNDEARQVDVPAIILEALKVRS